MALQLVKSLSVLAGVLAVAAVSLSVFMQDASGRLYDVLNVPATGVETLGVLFVPLVFGFFFYYFVSNL